MPLADEDLLVVGEDREALVEQPLAVLVLIAIDNETLDMLRAVMGCRVDVRVGQAATGKYRLRPASLVLRELQEGPGQPGDALLASDGRAEVRWPLPLSRVAGEFAQLAKEQRLRQPRRPGLPGAQTVDRRQRIDQDRSEVDVEDVVDLDA